MEQFLLKLVIPFICIAHCEKGPQMKVRGNLILISSDVAQSINRILPMEQNILPIRFKRKLSYDGHYAAEFVDKRKIELYFSWMKKYNPLYKDFTIPNDYDDLLEKFKQDLDTDAEEMLKMSVPQSGDTHNDEGDEDLEDEIDIFQESGPLPSDKLGTSSDNVEVCQQYPSVMCNKYEEDTETMTVANRLASLIIHLEESNVLHNEQVTDEVINDHMTDEIQDFEPEEIEPDTYLEDEVVPDEEIDNIHNNYTGRLSGRQTDEGLTKVEMDKIIIMSEKQRKETLKKMDTISLAPGEKGEFRNWKEDIYLEEKAFPHLFPYGVGGYLSSCLSSGRNMGFAVYCRNRMKSADPKFRNDQIYMFFLLLVKELMELKNCKSTYLRQARNTPGLSVAGMTNLRYQSLERYSRSFSVFKKMRGTSTGCFF